MQRLGRDEIIYLIILPHRNIGLYLKQERAFGFTVTHSYVFYKKPCFT